MPPIHLRDVLDADLAVLFAQRADAVSARMAAFGTKDADESAFAARWKKGVADGGIIAQKAIVADGEVVGFVGSFLHGGKPQVTYWIARSHWGLGIASAALSQLLALVTERPLYASAASDNVASLRVLRNCGFVVVGSERAFANARGEEIDETLLRLD